MARLAAGHGSWRSGRVNVLGPVLADVRSRASGATAAAGEPLSLAESNASRVKSELWEAAHMIARLRGIDLVEATEVLQGHAVLMGVPTIEVARAVLAGSQLRPMR